MRLLLTTSANPLFVFEPETGLSINCNRSLACHMFFRRPKSLHKQFMPLCSINASAGNHIGAFSKVSTNLHYLASQFMNASSLKKFPRDKAKLMVKERLVVLGKDAVQWSLVVLLCLSFLSDAVMAVTINREILVPLGLFIGVLSADFLKELFQEISGSRGKGGNDLLQLWGFGLFFVALRIICLSFKLPGRVLFAHIGNGGLMQTLWLAKELKAANFAHNREEANALLFSRD